MRHGTRGTGGLRPAASGEEHARDGDAGPPVRASAGAWSLGPLLREHAVFAVLFAVGAVLRIATSLTYRPAMQLVQDSFSYLADADDPVPNVIRPNGYSFFLRLLQPTDRLAVVPAVQHVMGLSIALLVYLLLRRLRARPWLAALGAAPVLLDATQVYLEQFILSETFFETLLAGSVGLLLWTGRPRPPAAGAAGLLLGAAAVTRGAGLPLAVPALLYLLVRRVGWRVVVCFLAAVGVVVGGYATWFHSHHDRFAISDYDGYFLTGRLQPFVDCSGLDLPPLEAPLCDDRPVDERPSSDYYVWNPAAPLRRTDVPPGVDRNAVAMSFAKRVIRDQPATWAAIVVRDILHYFSPGRRTGPKDNPVAAVEFSTKVRPQGVWRPTHPPSDPYVGYWTSPGDVVVNGTILANHGFGLRRITPSIDVPLAEKLNWYQRFGVTPGPALALAVVLAVASLVRPARSELRHLRWAAGLLVASGLLLLLVPAATATFDYRYMTPSLVYLPPAGVVAAVVLFPGARRRDPPPSPGASSAAAEAPAP